MSYEPIAITASTTLTEFHAGAEVVMNAAAGLTVTLPAATGTGRVYMISAGTTVTSNNYIIQVANATDTIAGGVAISTDIAGVTMQAAGTDDTITMNGTTTGGIAGSWVRLTDTASGSWKLEGVLVSSGVEADPFSAAVS